MAGEVDGRIAELEQVLAALPAEGPERRAVRSDLAAALAARYVTAGGADGDRDRARELAGAVLADPDATADERQRMSLLLTTVTMVADTPAAALRGHPRLDADALRRTEAWAATTGPAAATAGLAALQAQLASIPDPASLPPAVRASIEMMQLLAPLLGGHEPSPDDVARIEAAVAAAPADLPGMELLRPLLALVRPAPPAGPGRIGELEGALAGLAADDLLTPVLQQDLARALISTAGSSGPGSLSRATHLLEQAVAGMAEDHPLHDEAVRMLAGALVSTAASDPTAESLARAEQVAAQALAQSREQGSERRGPDLFLRSLVGLLRGIAGDDGAARTAVRDLVESVDLLPADHPLRPVAVGQLGALLADRHLTQGMLEDADAAGHVLGEALAAVSADDPETGAFLTAVAAMGRVNQAIRIDDVPALGAARDALRDALDRLADGHPLRGNLELVLAVADLRTALTGGGDVPAALAALRRTAAEGAFPGIPPGVVASMVHTMDVLGGMVDADPAAIVDGINRMEAELATPAFPLHQAGRHALLGKAYLAAHDAGINPEVAAERAVVHLDEARRLLDEHHVGVAHADVVRDLAAAYRKRGDAEQSRRTAFAALAATTGIVLLQTGVADAVVTARGAADDAATLARWCLADDDVPGAVQAMELGRGLALHAATSALAVPTLLTEIGRPELADAWRAAAAARRTDPAPWALAEPAVPPGAEEAGTLHARAVDDLRHEVLGLLRGTEVGRRLFTAPTPAAIGTALAAVDGDVFVYLVPGDTPAGGHLLLVDRDGVARAVAAPLLRIDPDGPPARFRRTRQFTPGWGAALDAVCAWAGRAVIDPLRATLPSGPDPVRVVLVPSGVLGAVPWAAAHLPVEDRRYACAEMLVSTAASARQFLDVTARSALPLDLEPVLVADPLGDLVYAVDEVVTVQEAFYPDAVLLGDFHGVEALPDGPPLPVEGTGTPQEVLARLPGAATRGASLLHLACHARTAGSAEASYLDLTERLTIRTVLEHAEGRAVDTPGPLVVLSACVSDLTEHDEDEALTLATAFLAAGAVAVVGSRWAVDDQRTAILMFAFHHFLARVGQRPAEALRSAQLWMLDPRRQVLPGMPDALIGDMDRTDLTDVAFWGAFGHHGR